MRPPDAGAYYVLSRPDQVARGEGDRLTRLTSEAPMTWSLPGPGRRAAAAAVLADAMGSAPDVELVYGFSGDVLDYYGTAPELVLSAEEVRAWCRDRGPELAKAGTPAFESLPQALADRDRELRAGPRPGWLAVYRTIHGEPQVPATRRHVG